jgi:hypothetical protein
MDREIVSFDPTVQNANMATFAVYDYLMKLMPDGTAQPYLAQSMASPDGGLQDPALSVSYGPGNAGSTSTSTSPARRSTTGACARRWSARST